MRKLRDKSPPFLHKTHTCAAAIGHGISPVSPVNPPPKTKSNSTSGCAVGYAVGFCLFYFLRFAVFLTVFLDL